MPIEHETGCPYEHAQRVLSGKWTLIIARILLVYGPQRFNELQRMLGSVAPGTLTKHLKAMEADGIVARRSYDEVPPRVEYSLTDLGRELGPLIREFERWGALYAERRGPAGR